MKTTENRTAFWSSVVVLVATLASTLAALIWPSIYRDNFFVRTAWRANDWVTLFLLPVFSFVLFRREQDKAQLLWFGMLGYFAYNFTFYLFGAAFNKLFLFYVSIVSISGLTLLSLASSLVRRSWTIKAGWRKGIATYSLFIALLLLSVEVPPIIAFLSAGTVPETVRLTAHPTAVVYALDLSYVIPVSAVCAVLLWQNKPLGVVLAALMLVKGAAYGLVLVAGTVLIALREGTTDPLLPFYIAITIGGLLGLTILLRQSGSSSFERERKRRQTTVFVNKEVITDH